MKVLIIPLLLVAVTGCASRQVWYNPDKTPAEAHQALGASRVEAARAPVTTTRQMSGLGAFMSASIVQNQQIEAGMLARGYLPTDAKTITNASAWPKK